MSNIKRIQVKVKPKYKGLKKVKLVWLDIKKINFNKINHARKKPVSMKRVIEISNAIKNGDYYPYAYEPPMVEYNKKTRKYDLLTGNHRFQGHELALEKEMWVAVVEFDTDENKKIAQSRENSEKKGHDFGQEYRTDEDAIHLARQILSKREKKGVTVVESDITNLLKEMDITKSKILNNMKYEIAKELKNAPEFALTITTGDLNLTATKIEEKEPKTKTITKSFGTVNEESRRADLQTFNNAMEIKCKYGSKTPIKIVAAFNDLNANQIPTARERRIEIFEDYEKKIVKQADVIKSGDYIRPEFYFVKQITQD